MLIALAALAGFLAGFAFNGILLTHIQRRAMRAYVPLPAPRPSPAVRSSFSVYAAFDASGAPIRGLHCEATTHASALRELRATDRRVAAVAYIGTVP